MPYTTESGVYDRTGFSTAKIQSMSGKAEAAVTTLVEGYISDAEAQIREDIGYPIRISEERHYGDGNKNAFELGPADDPFAEEGDYDPEDGLVKVYNAWFGKSKMRKPYPEDCELGTDLATASITDWGFSNATVSSEGTVKIAGTYSTKAIFSASGYIQYPDGTNESYLDKIVDAWTDLFFWVRNSDVTKTITVRIYDKDGNYAEQEITLRQNNVGQYVWLDLDQFTSPLDWDTTQIQYIRFYVSGACTIYVDNMCFADSWAFTAPAGLFHVSVADNISAEGAPSEGFPFYVSYGYDPFLASVPRYIKEAAEWMAGVYIIDYLRGIKYEDLDFEVYAETLEADTPFQRGGLLGVRTNMLKNYERCMRRWGGGSYGVI